MAGTDALGRQFARHQHPLGGAGGVEDNLRWRAEYETRHPSYAPQHQMDDGAAMATFNHHKGQTHVFTPSNQSGSGQREFGELYDLKKHGTRTLR